jgi:hypothetical protein
MYCLEWCHDVPHFVMGFIHTNTVEILAEGLEKYVLWALLFITMLGGG